MRTIQSVIDLLRNQEPHAYAEGARLAAAVFDSVHGSPWPAPDRIDVGNAATEDLQTLRELLIDFVHVHSGSDIAGTALWALGRSYDSSLRSVFVTALQANVKKNPGVAYQALIALDNIGEPALNGTKSMSASDVDQIRDLARRILDAER